MTKQDKETRSLGELVQFKIIEQPYEVKVPTFVEVKVEKPVFIEKEYELPVIKEVEYEKPIINMKDITDELKPIVLEEVKKAILETVATLRFSIELPMPRVIQVGKK